jgi:lysozyme
MTLHDALLKKHGWDGHINEAGLGIIKSFEGWSSPPYLCPAGRWTIGWGSTWDIDGNAVTGDHPDIDEEHGTDLLKRELRHVESAIGKLIKVPLTEGQFSSLCSFAFNVGTGNLQNSTLRARLNRGEYEGASAELPKWRRAGGRILKGLVRRRIAERALFDGDLV